MPATAVDICCIVTGKPNAFEVQNSVTHCVYSHMNIKLLLCCCASLLLKQSMGNMDVRGLPFAGAVGGPGDRELKSLWTSVCLYACNNSRVTE